MAEILIGYFERSRGGIAIVCDLDSWPERSYQPHGIRRIPVYVRLATKDEIEVHLKGRRRVCSHFADTLEQLLKAEKEVLPPDVYAKVEAALRKHDIPPHKNKSLKLFGQSEEVLSIADVVAGESI